MNRTSALEEIGKVVSAQIIKVLDNNLRSCINCSSFKEDAERCVFHNARPPARVIACACEQWNYDEQIPF